MVQQGTDTDLDLHIRILGFLVVLMTGQRYMLILTNQFNHCTKRAKIAPKTIDILEYNIMKIIVSL
jgi:hypothetical protein